MEGKRHIIIVEDDISILMGLKDNLIAEGYTVKTADNGKDGFILASENDFDLLLLDVMLPGMNGFEICKKMKLKIVELVFLKKSRKVFSINFIELILRKMKMLVVQD